MTAPIAYLSHYTLDGGTVWQAIYAETPLAQPRSTQAEATADITGRGLTVHPEVWMGDIGEFQPL